MTMKVTVNEVNRENGYFLRVSFPGNDFSIQEDDALILMNGKKVVAILKKDYWLSIEIVEEKTPGGRVSEASEFEVIVMRFTEWFDPHNPEHMKAYEVLTQTGAWPEGFMPGHTEYGYLAVTEIQSKMASAWLHAMKHGQIIGSSPFDA